MEKEVATATIALQCFDDVALRDQFKEQQIVMKAKFSGASVSHEAGGEHGSTGSGSTAERIIPADDLRTSWFEPPQVLYMKLDDDCSLSEQQSSMGNDAEAG